MGIARKLANWAVIAVAAAIILAFALPSYRQGEASIAGSRARDFSLTLDGKNARLSDFRGKVVVLNFFGSWCQPCVEEAPGLNRLQQHIASHNAIVIGVAADEDEAAYKKFLLEHATNYPTYRDPATKENRSAIAESYGTVMVPETYIIDRNGKIARKIIGYQDWDSPEMLAYFDQLLAHS
jgi:cytochrome c biogenesis protein CcmG, thiol:disulfide interchange protein DsbE